MRNEEVATPCATDTSLAQRRGASTHGGVGGIDAGADHADGAQPIDDSRLVRQSFRQVAPQAILVVQVLPRHHHRHAVGRGPERGGVELLAAHPARIERTIGEPRLLIIASYEMRVSVERLSPSSSRLTIFIAYELPRSGFWWTLGLVLARSYSRWCLRGMCRDTKRVLEATSTVRA